MTNAPTHQELLAWIRLARSDGIGAKTFRHLIERFGTATAAIASLPDVVRQSRRPLKLHPPEAAERELSTALRAGLTPLTWHHPHFPEALKATEDAPPLLLVLGQTEVLTRPMVAIVGARNATLNGRKMAKALAAELAAAGIVVVSGLARGIDGAAHDGALSVADGKTVAVLAGGTDVIYPPEHADLHRKIAGHGLVISEMPPGTEPQAHLFPRRNRIVSGLSLGVVVVEATLRSGSLITARLAAEQGRDVFAVPGFPMDPRAQGPNSLIRDGATLVQSVDDIISSLPLKRAVPAENCSPSPEKEQRIDNIKESEITTARAEIERALGTSPVAVDELVRQCQVSAAIVATVLTELELVGRLERLPGNRVVLIGTV